MPLIYEPRGRAKEYAPWAMSTYAGCDHGCIYCFVPNATMRSRDEFSKPHPRPNFLETLEKEAAAFPKTGEKILLCFSCDPYELIDVELQHTRRAMQILNRYGLNYQILTKAGVRSWRDVDLYKTGDAYAATLTLLDEQQSRIWEPKAAPPAERTKTLEKFYRQGVETWVSLEPVLNPASALELIRRTHEFTDLYKVGKLNYQSKADPIANFLISKIDWRKFAHDAVMLLESLGKRYYIKNDLRVYLEGGDTE